MKTIVKAGAVLAGLALVSACGSSKTTSGSSSTAAPVGTTATTATGGSATSGQTGGGSPITVMSFGQFQATAFSFPEMADAAKAAANAANAAGGINGQKIKVVVCNDQGDPNIAAGCARTAVKDKVAAVIGSISLYDTTFIPIIQAAGIPYVGPDPLVPADYTSPVAFPIDGGNPAGYGGAGIALVKAGCTKVGVLNDSEVDAQGSGKLLITGIKSAGGTVVAQKAVADSAPDFSPAVSALLGAGAKCIGVAETPAAMAKVIGAARQSSDSGVLLSGSIATVPLQVVQALKGAANGMLLTTSSYTPDSPQVALFRQQLHAENPKALVDSPAEVSWSAMETFIQVAKTVKDVDASSMLAALNNATAVTLPTYPKPIDFAAANPAQGYSRLFNTSTLIYKVVNGAYVLTSPTPTSVKAVLGS